MAAALSSRAVAAAPTGISTASAARRASSSKEAALCIACPKSITYSGLRRDELVIATLEQSHLRSQVRRAVWRPSQQATKSSVVVTAAASAPKKILMLGGTRFIGLYLARLLVKDGHEVTLFTRGKSPITQQIPGESDEEYADYSSKVVKSILNCLKGQSLEQACAYFCISLKTFLLVLAQVKHLKGDRGDPEAVKSALEGTGFQVVYDINGREATDLEPVLDALPNLEHYIFCSSAGVYLKTDQLPHREQDAVDPKSRHKGKLDTEAMLQSRGVAFTSVRPVYIYGPLNYNPVEEWFFQRLAAGRPIPVPNSGLQITQLGHVKDLAVAFVKILGNEKAIGQIYNISGPKYVTFDGIAKACAKAGGFPAPEIIHYNPKEFDFGKKKGFPLRDQHFFASNEKAEKELGWKPEFDLVEGLTDSYNHDFGRGTFRKEADFSTDDMILEKVGVKVPVSA
eukprot:SM000028S10085  [mRNA]  locus=s28:372777:376179:+ [translate_table: standard]